MPTKRTTLGALTLLAACAFPAVPSEAQEHKITVVSYGGAYTQSQREAFYKPFTAATGVRVQEEDAV